MTIASKTVLGTTIPELGIEKLGSLHVGTWPKKKFSMYIPEIEAGLKERQIKDVVIVGLEVCHLIYVCYPLKPDSPLPRAISVFIKLPWTY